MKKERERLTDLGVDPDLAGIIAGPQPDLMDSDGYELTPQLQSE